MDRRVTPPKRVTLPTWGPYLDVNNPLKRCRRNVIFKLEYRKQQRQMIYMKSLTELSWEA